MKYILILLTILSIIGIIKGVIKKFVGGLITLAILSLCFISWKYNAQTPTQFIDGVKTFISEVTPKRNDSQSNQSDTRTTELVQGTGENISGNNTNTSENPEDDTKYPSALTGNEKSSTDQGAVEYGATFIMGNLDNLKRATFAHIRVQDSQEPGSNGIKRPQRITTNPAGWSNHDKTNDRTHLVGFQFSGINSDPRNLVTATAYLNRGIEKSGSDDTNPDGMLFYEQQLDKWLRQNKNAWLDLYVQPNYEGESLIPTSVTMRWVGVDKSGNLIPIETGGHATSDGEYRIVTLLNQKA